MNIKVGARLIRLPSMHRIKLFGIVTMIFGDDCIIRWTNEAGEHISSDAMKIKHLEANNIQLQE